MGRPIERSRAQGDKRLPGFSPSRCTHSKSERINSDVRAVEQILARQARQTADPQPRRSAVPFLQLVIDRQLGTRKPRRIVDHCGGLELYPN